MLHVNFASQSRFVKVQPSVHGLQTGTQSAACMKSHAPCKFALRLSVSSSHRPVPKCELQLNDIVIRRFCGMTVCHIACLALCRTRKLMMPKCQLTPSSGFCDLMIKSNALTLSTCDAVLAGPKAVASLQRCRHGRRSRTAFASKYTRKFLGPAQLEFQYHTGHQAAATSRVGR